MTANRPEGHDRLGPPLRTPPARNSGHGLVLHAIDFAPPAGSNCTAIEPSVGNGRTLDMSSDRRV